jgi:hypothetical protein
MCTGGRILGHLEELLPTRAPTSSSSATTPAAPSAASCSTAPTALKVFVVPPLVPVTV